MPRGKQSSSAAAAAAAAAAAGGAGASASDDGADRVRDMRERVRVGPAAPSHSSSYSGLAPRAASEGEVGSFLGADAAVTVQTCTDEEVVFDLTGVDASVANALRRTMISEVPTMAIESVYISNNTSVMQDEVLAHRLGLLPIVADLEFFEPCQKDTNGEYSFLDINSITFELDVTCRRDPAAAAALRAKRPGAVLSGVDTGDSDLLYGEVYSGDFVFKPEGSQNDWIALSPEAAPRMAYQDILLCKLRPGQSIKLTCFAVMGTGKDHAKWSPVAPASYRLLPEVIVHAEDGTPRVTGEDAVALKELCPMDVFDIEDLAGGVKAATAARPRDCTMCRECVRDQDRWGGKVELARRKNHYVFSVESSHVMPAPKIVSSALKILQGKCATLRTEIDELKRRGTSTAADDDDDEEEDDLEDGAEDIEQD